MSTVTIIDYSVGNLLSITRALQRLGADVIIADTPQQIMSADRLILPGVGAFAKAMDDLQEKNLLEPLMRFHQKQRPFLGICVGMQLMFDKSCEFGEHQGLGLVQGTVKKLTRDGQVRLPHIGWTTVNIGNESGDFYFAHSFFAEPADPNCIKATARYGDNIIPAVIRQNNILGYQFHPEKSGAQGLALFKLFLAL